jgi:hypothetical protein
MMLIWLTIALVWPCSTVLRLSGVTSPIPKQQAGVVAGASAKNLVNPADQSVTAVDGRARDRVLDAYGKLPLSFELNKGQFDSEVKFISRTNGQTLFLTSTEAVLKLGCIPADAREEQPHVSHDFQVNGREDAVESKAESKVTVLRMKLSGANESARITGLGEMPGKTNYFIGNNLAKRVLKAPIYAKVRLWPPKILPL